MRNVRLIARLDVKSEHLVKGVKLEGLRKLGRPNDFARRYYEQGIDEVIYMDIVASLYERNSLLPIVTEAAREIFVPLTVGGGLRSVEDVRAALQAGADKVAVNTAALKRPALISDISNAFGSQCMVLSIEAQRVGPGRWEPYFDNGREKTGRDVVTWAAEAVALGAGEILLTSVDREGTQSGMDVELLKAVTDAVDIPVIASGGVGGIAHIAEAVDGSGVDAVAMAHVLHLNTTPLQEIHRWARSRTDLEMRV